MEIGLWHLKQHFDEAIASEGGIAFQVTAAVFFDAFNSFGGFFVIFFCNSVQDLSNENTDIHSAAVFGEQVDFVDELAHLEPP